MFQQQQQQSGASPQQVQEALRALYHHDSPAVRQQASAWLEAWQQGADAWDACAALLGAPDAGMEAHYFAAQTLRTKVQRDFEELPPGAAPALRDSLVALLARFAAGPQPVRVQLSLGVAALVAHLPAAEWGPGGAVGWLAARLGAEPGDASLPCMLELLTVLPQEAAGWQPSVRPERRRAVVDEMVAAAPAALQALAACLAGGRGAARPTEQALEAFAAWLKLAGGRGLPPAALLNSPLTAAALEGLADGDAFFGAVDAVVEVIFCTSDGGRPRPELAPLVQALVPRVMALRPRFHVCVQHALAERGGRPPPEGLAAAGGAGDGDEEAKAMARLFAEVGEAYTDLVAEGSPEAMAPVEALLDVACHPDDAICGMSFNFWHRLGRALAPGGAPQPIGLGPSGGEGARPAPPPPEERARRAALFAPAFERLVALIRGRVRFPDGFAEWHADDRDEFRRGRAAVGDTLLDAAAVLGGARCLELLTAPLAELAAACAGGAPFDWRAAEAALYCVRCVHHAAPPPGDALLLGLFGSLPALPAPAPALRYTVALAVGAYADWLAESARAPGAAPAARALPGQLLELLIAGLADPDAASASALSIKRLCDGCTEALAPAVEPLIALYREVQGAGGLAGANAVGLGAGAGGPRLDLDEDDVQQLTEGVALVAAALPDAARRACVRQMLDTVVLPMQEALSGGPGGGPDAARLPAVLPLVGRVATIFRAARLPEDVAEALIRLWPWLEAALDAFGADAEAAERLCRAPRLAVRSAGAAAAPAVPLLARALPPRFAAQGHSAFLFVASELVKVFGGDAAFDGELGPMLAAMLGAGCARLPNLAAVSADPALADDVFLLAGRCLSYAPRLVATPALLPPLLDAALAGALVQHREACGSVLAFVEKACDPSLAARCGAAAAPAAAAALRGALAPRAPALARVLLAGAAGGLPFGRLRELAAALGALLHAAGDEGVGWVQQCAAALPDEVATPDDRARLVAGAAAAARAQGGADDERAFSECLHEFADVCRRSRRAQAAAQRALLPQELQYTVRG